MTERTMDKQRLINQVFIARESGRSEDMLTLMKQTARLYPEQLNRWERNLLYQAHKYKYETTKSALVCTTEHFHDNFQYLSMRELYLSKQYITNITKELDTICHDAINLLEYLLRKATDDEQCIFYLMMQGEYFRYLFFLTQDPQSVKVLQNKAQAAYDRAQWLSQITLTPLNPVRLATILNYMVYLNDVLQDKAFACVLGRQILQDTQVDIDRGEEMDPICSIYLDRIRNNVETWTAIITRTRLQYGAAGDGH